MFILIDTDLEGLAPFYDYLNEVDDRTLVGFSSLDEAYSPDGGYHVVDILSNVVLNGRWDHLRLATIGARVWSNDFDVDSPIYAGAIPAPDKARKVYVDAQNADTRSRLFLDFGVNYVGRTKLNPRNMFVLDNLKGNPLHDPSKDPRLEALYASLPDDWWGSCGFVSSSNIDRLEAFIESFQGDVILLAFTTGAFSKLKFMGFDYVDTGVPKATQDFGIMVRDKANRLSYKLAQPEVPQAPIDPTGFKYVL